MKNLSAFGKRQLRGRLREAWEKRKLFAIFSSVVTEGVSSGSARWHFCDANYMALRAGRMTYGRSICWSSREHHKVWKCSQDTTQSLSFLFQSCKFTSGVCFPFMAIRTGLWFGCLALFVLLTWLAILEKHSLNILEPPSLPRRAWSNKLQTWSDTPAKIEQWIFKIGNKRTVRFILGNLWRAVLASLRPCWEFIPWL